MNVTQSPSVASEPDEAPPKDCLGAEEEVPVASPGE